MREGQSETNDASDGIDAMDDSDISDAASEMAAENRAASAVRDAALMAGFGVLKRA